MRRSNRRQAVLSIGSQGLYALSNVGLTVFAALTLSPTDFGLFSMIIIAYLVVRGPIVAGIGHGAIIDSSTPADETIARSAAGALRLGTAFGAAGLLAALATSSIWFAIAAVGFPVMVCFEVVRVVALGVGRSGLALRGDLAWLVAQIVVVTLAWGRVDAWPLHGVAALWVIGGVAATLSVAPALRGGRPSLRSAAPLNRTLALDDLLATGLQRGALASGALVVSATAVAQTRLAIVPFNVAAVAVASLQPMLLAEVRRTMGAAAEIFVLWSRHLYFAAAVTAANLIGLLIVFVVFEEELGANFQAAADVLWWIALLRLSSAATLIISSTVKAHPAAASRSVLVPRVVHGMLTLVLVLAFGATIGWTGLAIGLSLGSLGGTLVWAFVAIPLIRQEPLVRPHPVSAERPGDLGTYRGEPTASGQSLAAKTGE